MPYSARPGLTLLVLALCSITVSAQQATPPSPTASGRMYLDVVVTPKSGPPVSGLKQEDFTILDNKAAVKIESFAALGGPQAPIEVVLVVDAINTNLQNLTYERAQLDKFLKANGGHLAYPTSLIMFNDSGMTTLDSLSKDGEELSSTLDKQTLGLREEAKFSGPTGEADKLHLCLVQLQKLVVQQAARPGRKIILWVSPGWPLLSSQEFNYDAQQSQQIFRQTVVMYTLLRRAGVTLYSIDPTGSDANRNRLDYEQYLKPATKPSQTVPGYLSLQVLAIQSGGMALMGSNDIASQLDRCMADFTSYYELTFEPPTDEHRDNYHTVQVKVSQPGLTARARTGYYSQP